MKYALLVLCFLCLFCIRQSLAQAECSGSQLFTEKKCAGDEVSRQEQELYRIINEYRAQNNLPQVPLSPALSLVANRHLIDLETNIKTLTHGWSNCAYDVQNKDTWNCVYAAPQRLGTDYGGRGYENLYRNFGTPATPALALDAWKKSPLHNSLILNLSFFKDDVYDGCGIAIRGNWVSLWFGSSSGARNNSLKPIKGANLGLSFEQVTEGLTDVFSITKVSSVFEADKWIGTSKDKATTLEIYGKRENILEATLNFRARLVKNRLTEKDKALMLQFLKNVMPDWSKREEWFASTLEQLYKNPKMPQSTDEDKRTISLDASAKGFLSLTVKPSVKK